MYILDTKALQIGDIILTGSDGKLSKIIKKFTGGNFSHAMLYVSNGSYIHSDRDGVHAGNTQRLLFESEDNIRVLRPKNPKAIENACFFARSQVGKAYSVPNAINSRVKLSVEVGANRQFCSKLVAEAYDSAGLKLTTNPALSTPKDIEDSKELSLVPSVLRAATQAEIEFANSENPLDRQKLITNEILEQARVIFKKDIQTFEDLSYCVFENKKHDKRISNIIKKSGYLNLMDEEKTKNPWRYNFDIFMSISDDPMFLLDMAFRERDSSISLKRRFEIMLTFYKEAHNAHSLEYTRINKELYLRLCGDAQTMHAVSMKVINKLN